MITNQAYVLKSVFGDDMTSEIKSYMVHPIKESRELMDNELYNHIWSNIYEKFKTDSDLAVHLTHASDSRLYK